ncbi:MAG TPA: hypothetical protein VEI02_03425 [Planctomycetota bacterium]|nr:hypothetical protein [Planctomycetota bacterium]
MPHARFGVLLCLALAACSSGSKKPSERDGVDVYRYDFDFVWDLAQEELREWTGVAEADRERKTLTSEWETRLAPFKEKGERHRLIVTFSGDREEGWRLTAKQESESNSEQEKPLDPEEADWSSSDNDGALAARFLRNFDRRARPDESWRKETRR